MLGLRLFRALTILGLLSGELEALCGAELGPVVIRWEDRIPTSLTLVASGVSGGKIPNSYRWEQSPFGLRQWNTDSYLLVDRGSKIGAFYDYRVAAPDNAGVETKSEALSANTLFPVDSTFITYTPGSWFRGEGNPAAWTATNRGGSEMRFGFTGTSAALALDVSNITPNSIGIAWEVDDGPRQSGLPSASVTLASGLKTGAHTARFWNVGQSSQVDCWNLVGATPGNVLKIIGIQLDVGASLSKPPSVPSEKMIFFGDSITVGVAAGFNGSSDFIYAYPTAVSLGLGVEPSLSAFASGGWTVTAAGSNVPPLGMMLGFYWNGQPRSLTDVYTRALINMGQNDGGSYASIVWHDLSLLRSALGLTTKVYLLQPFSGKGASSITSGFASYCGSIRALSLGGTATYQKCLNDRNAYLIDLGSDASTGFSGSRSFESGDGTHPNAFTHAKLAAMILQAILEIEGPGRIRGPLNNR